MQTWRTLSTRLDTANRGQRLRFGVFFSFLFFSFFFLLRRAFHVGLCFSNGSRVLFTELTSILFQKKTLKLSPTILFTQLKIILLQYLSGKDFDSL